MKKILIFFITFLFLLLAVLITIGLTGDKTVLKTVIDNPKLPSIEIDGIRLHSESFGNNKDPLIVVLHGGPGGDYRYLLSLKSLSSNHQVVFYDQRGSGLSERVTENRLSLDSFREELHLVIEHYKGNSDRPVYIIGHSWGAMLATYYVSKYGKGIEKLVLAEPGFLNIQFFKIFYDRTNGLQPRDPSFKMGWNVLKAIIRSFFVNGPDSYSGEDYMNSQIMNSSPDETPIARYWCENTAKNASMKDWRLGSLPMKVLAMNLIAEYKRNALKAKFDLTKGLDHFNKKVLFITGDCNSIIGPDIQVQQARLFPKAEVKVIKNVGHTMFGEAPKDSIQIIREYFQEI
ncbi:MAG: hypothetical protein CL678_09515 [Bdellovibrionaceae bacterium]|nr:hypothetical protein [Pseudobdellovibrionaceae bacterium]|tara:strand:+ start:3799 stop:4833 length:1035 start_codon:yes stop_codon:yes gene_type:complete